jgi:CRISPR-associated protein Cmr1
MTARHTTLTYRLSFNTPAFLGNAEQQGQWRTPPIKALIRQWWRVVKAPDPAIAYDHKRLLNAENLLFGAAGEEGQSFGRSRVRLRLDNGWEGGVLKPAPGDSIAHDESPVKWVAANTYLGYGPLGTKNDRTALDPAKASNTLRLRILDPDAVAEEVTQAIQLAVWFGGLGSRSRNAFGSLHWEAGADTPALRQLVSAVIPAQVCRHYVAALKCDWPHAIGHDDDRVPLVWHSKALHSTWMAAMKELAILKIGLRTSPPFKFNSGGKSGHPEPLPRHVLAYPAGGNHAVNAQGWGKDGRMANQLRLRVHRDGAGYRSVIVHVPCGVPAFMREAVRRLPDERGVWETVHRYFDQRQELTRLGG